MENSEVKMGSFYSSSPLSFISSPDEELFEKEETAQKKSSYPRCERNPVLVNTSFHYFWVYLFFFLNLVIKQVLLDRGQNVSVNLQSIKWWRIAYWMLSSLVTEKTQGGQILE